jgi:hypothetical protein
MAYSGFMAVLEVVGAADVGPAQGEEGGGGDDEGEVEHREAPQGAVDR